MQRLEVSSVVRLIYRSLGVKGLKLAWNENGVCGNDAVILSLLYMIFVDASFFV